MTLSKSLDFLEELEKSYDEEATIRKMKKELTEKLKLLQKGIRVPDGQISRRPTVPWRTLHPTTTEQFHNMLSSNIKTDCTITVVSEDQPIPWVIKVHRLQLIRASSVFEAMLMGDMSEAKTGEITVTDLSKGTVENMIEFIYSDEVQLNTFEDAFQVALAAEKYQIKQLRDISVSVLHKFLSFKNVWSTLKLANLLKLQDLTDSCIEVLQWDLLDCINNEEFLQTSEENVVILLEQDELISQNELLLVDATVNWARQEAQRRGLAGDDAGVRTVIEPKILRLLRLSTIPLEQFKSGPGLSDWLTQSEKEQIMEHQELENTQKLPEHLSSCKKEREQPRMLEKYIDRKVHHCKRKVLFTEDNLTPLKTVVDCVLCKLMIPVSKSVNVTLQTKCAHATVVFRVNSKCSLVGFECPSRVLLNNHDPTLLKSNDRPFYIERMLIMGIKIGPSLVKSRLKECQLLFRMCHMKKNLYDSSVIIMFPNPMDLDENNWYDLMVMFYSSADESLPVEYPYCTRPNEIVCGNPEIKLELYTQEIPGYCTSWNDGVFKTFFVTT